MKPIKHIFLQINTDNIIEIYKEKEKTSKKPKITCKEVLNNCLIFSQGSMSMGDPIKNFIVETNDNEEIGFTILPLCLFGKHLLYFKNFTSKVNKHIETIPKLDGSRKPVSFIIDVNSLRNATEIPFSLKVILEYQDLKGKWKSVELSIDPVLQVKQS